MENVQNSPDWGSMLRAAEESVEAANLIALELTIRLFGEGIPSDEAAGLFSPLGHAVDRAVRATGEMERQMRTMAALTKGSIF